MKTAYLLLVLFILSLMGLSLRSNAQLSVGIEAGMNTNYLHTNISNLTFTEYKPANGFSIGVPVAYKIDDWLSIQSGINLTQKRYEYVRNGFFEGVYTNYTNSYIQLPLMGHFMFGGEKLKGFLNAGGYGAYWVSGSVKGVMPNGMHPATGSIGMNSIFDIDEPYSFNEKYQFNSTKDNRVEWGVLIGIGVSYQLNKVYELYAEGRYTRPLTEQQKKYMTNQIPRYTDTYGISIGCLRHFK